MKSRAWAAFWLVGLIWGSSFLFIRVGVQEFRPIEVVFIRTVIAAVGLNILLVLRGKRIPTDWPTLRALIIIGLGNVVAPFLLISWSEQFIESGLASVLQSTASLFTLVTAHFAFADERITLQKIAGLTLGFIGVLVLSSRNWSSGEEVNNGLLGQLGMILASLCYAIFTTYSRKLIRAQIEPLQVSTATITTAAVVTGIVVLGAPLMGVAPTNPLQANSNTLIALALLGVVNTFVAYIFYYFIVQQLGAARASMVTYIVPMVGLLLGVLVADEILDERLIFGALLIFAGIAVVNLRFSRGEKVLVPASTEA